ncbi:hypothetical protein CEXT_339571 [Caerostris extrusa]|uniref:Uncharacterized protein n=1 Tax=Caerostris extrusa TaxID=172846 RepID=A0AAV4TWR1_CAEEX|nr:hypothetical protein CEXT_339571 [Caerostris extrusa]
MYSIGKKCSLDIVFKGSNSTSQLGLDVDFRDGNVEWVLKYVSDSYTVDPTSWKRSKPKHNSNREFVRSLLAKSLELAVIR